MKLKDILAITDKNASVRVLYKQGKDHGSCGINPLATLSTDHRMNEFMDREIDLIVANKEDDFWFYVK